MMRLEAHQSTLTLARFSAEQSGAWMSAAAELIDAGERSHASSIPDEATRAQHMIGRALIRRAGADASGRHPMELAIKTDAAGKPYLGDMDDLHVSVAHTEGVVVLAAARVPVGVDVERPQAHPQTLRALARRLFAEEENAWLDPVPDDLLPDLFARLWTIKEAVGKALGAGVPAAFKGVVVTCNRDLLSLERVTIGPAAAEWTLHQLAAPGGEEKLAVAYAHPEMAIPAIELLTLDALRVS